MKHPVFKQVKAAITEALMEQAGETEAAWQDTLGVIGARAGLPVGWLLHLATVQQSGRRCGCTDGSKCLAYLEQYNHTEYERIVDAELAEMADRVAAADAERAKFREAPDYG